MFLVEVTWGVCPHKVYARQIKIRSDAVRMRETAKHFGYSDAKVVDEGVFKKAEAERAERAANARKSRKAG